MNEPIAPEQTRLRILCVGTGRDGTRSLSDMVGWLLAQSGGGRAGHEYASRRCHEAFCTFAETGDRALLGEIERMIDECPYACIAGSGYAAHLPLFAARARPGLRLIHLRRSD